jgi:hypothetical protein
MLRRPMNFNKEGINCRYVTTGESLWEIFPDRSRKTIPNKIKNKGETPTLIFFK